MIIGYLSKHSSSVLLFTLGNLEMEIHVRMYVGMLTWLSFAVSIFKLKVCVRMLSCYVSVVSA